MTRQSAIQTGSEAQIPINKDHSNMVKFAEADPDLMAVVHHLQDDQIKSRQPAPLNPVDSMDETGTTAFAGNVTALPVEEDIVTIAEELLEELLVQMSTFSCEEFTYDLRRV